MTTTLADASSSKKPVMNVALYPYPIISSNWNLNMFFWNLNM